MYLLDTHSFVWSVSNENILSKKVRKILEDRRNKVFVSSISFYELAYKNKLGKWPEVEIIVDNAEAVVQRMQYHVLEISIEHAIAAAKLPTTHRDPFDRILAAQSNMEGLTLITKDKGIDILGVETLW